MEKVLGKAAQKKSGPSESSWRWPALGIEPGLRFRLLFSKIDYRFSFFSKRASIVALGYL
jgi:hypothetical protein